MLADEFVLFRCFAFSPLFAGGSYVYLQHKFYRYLLFAKGVVNRLPDNTPEKQVQFLDWLIFFPMKTHLSVESSPGCCVCLALSEIVAPSVQEPCCAGYPSVRNTLVSFAPADSPF